MSFFKKKADPISDRAKALNDEISALEAQIRQLNNKIEHSRSHPRVRSTAVPNGPRVDLPPAATPTAPVFEQVDRSVEKQAQGEVTPNHYNDLGVRKYDIFAAFRRVANVFRGPSASNPKLVSYLAAGSIKGLRPLRYEKRIARNRFIVLSLFFVLILWGLTYALFGNR